MKLKEEDTNNLWLRRDEIQARQEMKARKNGKAPHWNETRSDGKHVSARHSSSVPEKKSSPTPPLHVMKEASSRKEAAVAEYPSCMTWTILILLLVIGIYLCKLGFKSSAHA